MTCSKASSQLNIPVLLRSDSRADISQYRFDCDLHEAQYRNLQPMYPYVPTLPILSTHAAAADPRRGDLICPVCERVLLSPKHQTRTGAESSKPQ